MRPIPRVLVALSLLGVAAATPIRAQLFYNGSDGGGWLVGKNTSFGDVFLYDNFFASGTWQVSSLFGVFFGNPDIPSPAPTQAYWEIRSGVGPGNAGTLLLSGTNALSWTPFAPYWNPSSTSTFLGEISGLNFLLPDAIYWMMIAPIGDGTQVWGLGFATGNDPAAVNPLIDHSGFISASYSPGLNYTDLSTDFSYGLRGLVAPSTVPEPASLMLIATGLAALGSLWKIRSWRRTR